MNLPGHWKESMSFLLIVNWHLWAWLTNICVGQSLACSFTYVSVSEVNKSEHTEQNFMELQSDTTAGALPALQFPKTVPVKEHISFVLFQIQSIWLGCGGRDPSLKLDNSKSPFFRTMACSLEELQGRMLMGPLLHLCPVDSNPDNTNLSIPRKSYCQIW